MSQADSPKKFKGVKKAYNYELCRYSCSCKQLKKMMNFFPMTKKKKKKIRRRSALKHESFRRFAPKIFQGGPVFSWLWVGVVPPWGSKFMLLGGFFAIFSLGGLSHPEVALGGVEAIFRLSEGGVGIRRYTPWICMAINHFLICNVRFWRNMEDERLHSSYSRDSWLLSKAQSWITTCSVECICSTARF